MAKPLPTSRRRGEPRSEKKSSRSEDFAEAKRRSLAWWLRRGVWGEEKEGCIPFWFYFLSTPSNPLYLLYTKFYSRANMKYSPSISHPLTHLHYWVISYAPLLFHTNPPSNTRYTASSDVSALSFLHSATFPFRTTRLQTGTIYPKNRNRPTNFRSDAKLSHYAHSTEHVFNNYVRPDNFLPPSFPMKSLASPLVEF